MDMNANFSTVLYLGTLIHFPLFLTVKLNKKHSKQSKYREIALPFLNTSGFYLNNLRHIEISFRDPYSFIYKNGGV